MWFFYYVFCLFFFFKQKTAYEIMPSLVGSEMCIRDRYNYKHFLPVEEFPAGKLVVECQQCQVEPVKDNSDHRQHTCYLDKPYVLFHNPVIIQEGNYCKNRYLNHEPVACRSIEILPCAFMCNAYQSHSQICKHDQRRGFPKTYRNIIDTSKIFWRGTFLKVDRSEFTDHYHQGHRSSYCRN